MKFFFLVQGSSTSADLPDQQKRIRSDNMGKYNKRDIELLRQAKEGTVI